MKNKSSSLRNDSFRVIVNIADLNGEEQSVRDSKHHKHHTDIFHWQQKTEREIRKTWFPPEHCISMRTARPLSPSFLHICLRGGCLWSLHIWRLLPLLQKCEQIWPTGSKTCLWKKGNNIVSVKIARLLQDCVKGRRDNTKDCGGLVLHVLCDGHSECLGGA